MEPPVVLSKTTTALEFAANRIDIPAVSDADGPTGSMRILFIGANNIATDTTPPPGYTYVYAGRNTSGCRYHIASHIATGNGHPAANYYVGPASGCVVHGLVFSPGVQYGNVKTGGRSGSGFTYVPELVDLPVAPQLCIWVWASSRNGGVVTLTSGGWAPYGVESTAFSPTSGTDPGTTVACGWAYIETGGSPLTLSQVQDGLSGTRYYTSRSVSLNVIEDTGLPFNRDGVPGDQIADVDGVEAASVANVDGVTAVTEGGIMICNDPRYMRKAA